jgi:hypothetical protein
MSTNSKKQGSRFDRAVVIFRKQGGIMRTAQALRAGIHPSTLYTMRDVGTLEVVSRGVYRLARSEPLGNPDLVTVATRVRLSRNYHADTSRGPRGPPARSGGAPAGPPPD